MCVIFALVTESLVQWIYCSTKKYKEPSLFHNRDPTKRGRERVVHAKQSEATVSNFDLLKLKSVWLEATPHPTYTQPQLPFQLLEGGG